MSIIKSFRNIFKNDSEAKQGIPWAYLSEESDLDQIITDSLDKPQVIYKHSTRCATSYFALKNLEMLTAAKYDNADFHMVDVIKNRNFSQYIGEKFGIRHESPQLLLVVNKSVSWNGSHQAVQSEILEERL